MIDFDTIENPVLREYASGGFENITGWGINSDLTKLFLSLDAFQKDQGITGNFFEIGVLFGRVAILMGLMARADEALVALDLFEDLQTQNVNTQTYPDGHSGSGHTRQAFEENLRRYGLYEKTEIIVGNSMYTNFSKCPELHRVRFAHIDGAHFVDATLSDLMKTQTIMVPGGIVIMDDWTHHFFTGVQEGIWRYLLYATPRLLLPFASGWNKLCLTTHAHHAQMVDYVGKITGHPRIKLAGFDVISLDGGP